MNKNYGLSKYENHTDKIEDYNLFEKRKIASKIIDHKCDLCDSQATAILRNWWMNKFYGCDGHTHYLMNKHHAEVKFSPFNIILK